MSVKKIFHKVIILLSFVLCAITIGISVHADTSLDQQLSGLSDDTYVLYLPYGGFITNSDGSANFTPSQLNDLGGTVMTVSEFRSQSAAGNNITVPALRSTSIPGKCIELASGQSYLSQGFSGGGWRYSGYFFHPRSGTGAYLLWETYVDSGQVGNQVQTSKHTGTAIYPGAGKRIYSDDNRGTYIWGACYSTINPINGTKYRVTNR